MGARRRNREASIDDAAIINPVRPQEPRTAMVAEHSDQNQAECEKKQVAPCRHQHIWEERKAEVSSGRQEKHTIVRWEE
jgi:hypothetical protein